MGRGQNTYGHPPVNHDGEWKNFWQRAALGLMTLCGVLSTYMIKSFIKDFDRLSSSVGGMESSVRELNGSLGKILSAQKVIEQEQERQAREILALKRKVKLHDP